MLVTMYGYEQNPSRGVEGVAYKRLRVVRRSANLNAHPQFCGGHKKTDKKNNMLTKILYKKKNLHLLYTLQNLFQ